MITNRMKKSVVMPFLMLVLAAMMLANCGGGGGSDSTPPPPGGTTDYKRIMVEAFRGKGDYTFIHGNNSIPDYNRIMVEDFRGKGDYTFIHGNNSPDGQTLYVAVNETSAGNGGKTADMIGAITSYTLKMSDVLAGTVSADSIIAENTVTGMSPAALTVAFRTSYTPDGTKIVLAGKDRVLLLDATTLAPLNGPAGDMSVGGGSAYFENHDAFAIDNDYALLALQSKTAGTTHTVVGAVVLYDLNAKAAVGAATNICSPCHTSQDPVGKTGGAAKNHALCGIDGKLTKGADNKYTGKLYSSSVGGGHVVEVDITIDPANTSSPITVNSSTQLAQVANAMGTATDMPMFHDVRFDIEANKVYYSAYKVDKTGTASDGSAHLGYVDLNHDNMVHSATIDATASAKASQVYCGSAQTPDYFIPMTMSYPAYIDVISKAAIKRGGHLSSSPTELYVAVNETSTGNGGKTADMIGAITSYRLKMSDVLAGTVTPSSIISQNTVTGMSPAALTVAFRTSYTPDGTKIVLAGKDRVLLLDATTLAPLNGAAGDTNVGGGSAYFENHDAFAIDNDYALLALQSKTAGTTHTVVGAVVLYDLNAKAAVGPATNICVGCHTSQDPVGKTGGAAKNHALCGIDGKLTKGANGKYTGKLYSSSVGGGHVVVVDLEIDPANTAAPITVKSSDQLAQVANAMGTATDMPMFHDVRFDIQANKVYYSAYKVDKTGTANDGRAHLGYVDMAGNVYNATIDATASAKASQVYCGSAQTKDYFIPMTMSYPAYIDVIKKSAVTAGASLK